MESQTVVENPSTRVLDDEARALRLAIDHARRGNAVAARILLVDICTRNPDNELAWLWRASLATTADEGLSYMDQVLRLNPQNRTALGWLAKMGRPAPAPPKAAESSIGGNLSGASHNRASENTDAGDRCAENRHSERLNTENSNVGGADNRSTDNRSADKHSADRSAEKQDGEGRSAERRVFDHSVADQRSSGSGASGSQTAGSRGVQDQSAQYESAGRQADAARTVARESPPSCPVCHTAIEPAAVRCASCRSVLIVTGPIDFALSRSADMALTAAAIEHWKTLAATGSMEAELALATVYLNVLDYARASHHLKQAIQRGLPSPTPVLLASGILMKVLMHPVVMVVDDSATIRDVVVRTLGQHEILPLPVGNPYEVIDTLAAQKPALVLLDVTMPGVDGLELCRKIRSNKETRNTPVIMLTGHDALIDKLVGKMAGATEYLTKPFKPDALLKTVRKYLEKRRG